MFWGRPPGCTSRGKPNTTGARTRGRWYSTCSVNSLPAKCSRTCTSSPRSSSSPNDSEIWFLRVGYWTGGFPRAARVTGQRSGSARFTRPKGARPRRSSSYSARPSSAQAGARAWAGGRPNLLNVAVTRAKEVVYVVGNRNLWREAGLFRDLDTRLESFEVSHRREEERKKREADAAERVRKELADREQAQRMEQWKRSGMPREWVLEHLDGWDQPTWVALVTRVRSSPSWPLNVDEMLAYLQSLRSMLLAERERRREEQRQRETDRKVTEKLEQSRSTTESARRGAEERIHQGLNQNSDQSRMQQGVEPARQIAESRQGNDEKANQTIGVNAQPPKSSDDQWRGRGRSLVFGGREIMRQAEADRQLLETERVQREERCSPEDEMPRSHRPGCGSAHEVPEDTTAWQDNAIRAMEGD
jgi:hypothetical protein